MVGAVERVSNPSRRATVRIAFHRDREGWGVADVAGVPAARDQTVRTEGESRHSGTEQKGTEATEGGQGGRLYQEDQMTNDV